MRFVNGAFFFVAVLLYAAMTATVILGWFTPELEVSVWRMFIASALLPLGWYYLLNKTAAQREWDYLVAKVRRGK